MGDNDVICLSSDDEFAHDELPQKKIKNENSPNVAESIESVSSEPNHSKTGEKSKAKDAESKPVVLDLPQEKMTSSDVSSLKRKSMSPDELTAKKKRKLSSETVVLNLQPGCSISPDESNDKPLLVVVDKKPVEDDADDAFFAFLSLCLQTDRCDEMEKAVERLKHNYERLNPAYRASKTFRDAVNKKRNAISLKGKAVVYHYMQVLKSEMKAGKWKEEEENHEDAEEEDSEEARRINQKIKKIEKAMKECQRMIKKYEEAEVDFDDENNSQYIKLERYKEKMVELHTVMCKYTHEHPDAGRSYLRPKHLRVTQIPSIDQAINSFINSKLSFSKRKDSKGKSFVDGLIFPDYVDILECVEKVNEELKMNMTKRAMQNMAEKAFTQLGKHLQEARRNDYWDTFSLHLENLENSEDPATKDADLAEKLAKNKIIAEANVKKVFEEFVRRQEEGKAEDKDDSPSEAEDDEDMETDVDEEDVDGKTNGDDTDEEFVTANKASLVSNNNNDVPSEPTTATASPSSNSAETEVVPIEVTLADVDTEDGENDEPVEEVKAQQLLRVRSFAKPSECWQSSQECIEEAGDDGDGKKSEVLEITEDEVTVVDVLPGRKTVLQSGINIAKTNVVVPSRADAKPISLAGRPVTIRAVNVASAPNKAINGQTSRYVQLAPVTIRSVPISSSAQNHHPITTIAAVPRFAAFTPSVRPTSRTAMVVPRPAATLPSSAQNSPPATKIVAASRPPVGSTTPVKIGPPISTSTPAVRLPSKTAVAAPRPAGSTTPVKIGPPIATSTFAVRLPIKTASGAPRPVAMTASSPRNNPTAAKIVAASRSPKASVVPVKIIGPPIATSTPTVRLPFKTASGAPRPVAAIPSSAQNNPPATRIVAASRSPKASTAPVEIGSPIANSTAL